MGKLNSTSDSIIDPYGGEFPFCFKEFERHSFHTACLTVEGPPSLGNVKKLRWGSSQNKTSSLSQRRYKETSQTSLIVQWIRICLPMQGTRVQPWPEKTSLAMG